MISLQLLIYIILYALIPGFFLKEYLLKKNSSFCFTLILSFYLGFFVLMAEYFICSILNILFLFPWINILFSIAYLIAKRKKIISWAKGIHFQKKMLLPVLYILFIYFLSYIYVTLPYANLLSKEVIYLPEDYFNHIGLITSLSKGFPAYDLKVSGTVLYYHYFQDLFFGMCKNIFRMASYDLLIQGTPMLVSFTFGVSTYAFMKPKENTNQKWTAFSVFFIFVCLANCGIPLARTTLSSGYTAWYNYHIFTSINANAFGLSAVSTLLLVIEKLDLKQFSLKDASLLFILLFITTGIKGPYGIVVLVAFSLALLLKVLTEKEKDTRVLLYILSSFLGFYIAYRYVITGTNAYGTSKTTEVSLSLTGTLERTIFSSIANHGTLMILLGLLVVAVVAIGPMMIYYCKALVLDIRKAFQHSLKIELATMHWTVIIGIGGFLLVNQSGYSQGYFLNVAILPMLYLCFNEVLNEKITKLDQCYLSVITVFGLILMALDGKVNLAKGLAAQDALGLHYNVAVSDYSITQEEYEGLEWLRENTDQNAIVATDHRGITGYETAGNDCRFFAYSALSERQMYLEGFSYSSVSAEALEEKIEVNDAIYASGGETLYKLLENNHIDYVIVTKRYTDAFDPVYEKIQPCFSNDAMTIYKVE